jgi:demethylmenaquinone methyltransferase/2-methoxy-6-polyprenyl-1,4-benzoquinol methylase
MFDRIAPRYDLLNHLLSAGIDVRWRRRAVDLLGRAPGSRVLDVCTGTADLLIEYLRRDERNRGAGIDLSGGMLGLGAAKLRGAGVAAQAGLSASDAARLPFRDACFDGTLVAFGIRNVGNPTAALAEMHRVLRPGGRAVILEFSMPQGLLGSAYRLYFTKLLPMIGGWISGDRTAYAYLPASVERFATPSEFASLMQRAGFAEVRWQSLTGGIAHVYAGEKAA